MPRLVRYSMIGLLAVLGAPLVQAQNAAACQTVQFSERVLQKFPNIRMACLDVITKSGQMFAVVKADLIRLGSDTAYLRVKLPGGGRSDTRAIKFKPEFRVMIDGKPMRVHDLAVGQEITTYVKVTEPMMAMAPAVESEPLDLTPIPDPEPYTPPPVAAAQPHTASQLPGLGLLGLALLGAGGVLALVRARRSRGRA